MRDAIADFDSVVRIDRTHTPVYARRGYAHMQMNALDAAFMDYTEAIRRQPGDSRTYFNRGNVRQLVGEFRVAIRDYSRALRLDSQLAVGYNNRGCAYAALEEFDSAEIDLTEVLKIAPQSSVSFYNRANVRCARGDFANATQDYVEALRLEPKNWLYWSRLAWLQATLSKEFAANESPAMESALNACEFSGWQESFGLSVLGAAYAAAGDWDHAIDCEGRAIEMTDDDIQKRAAMLRLQSYQRHETCSELPEDFKSLLEINDLKPTFLPSQTILST